MIAYRKVASLANLPIFRHNTSRNHTYTMRKTFTLSLFSALLIVVPASTADATVMGVDSGDLIKIVGDNDPTTVEDSVVYYLDRDWLRHPFPNRHVYDSWYENFDTVEEISKEDMAQFRLGSPITYRPGTKLVKIPSIPKVYTVEPGGVLRWITSEDVAISMFGEDWADMVHDVPESFFLNYTEGVPHYLPLWPTGTLVRRTDGAYYLIEGMRKRFVPEHLLRALRLRAENAVQGSDEMISMYGDISAFTHANELKYLDTSQISRVETLPSPQVDFVSTETTVKAAELKPLATLRLSVGGPVLVKGIAADISGPLWTDGEPNLTDLQFVHGGTGEVLFGVKQLEGTPGSATEAFTMVGSWLAEENEIVFIELRAKVSVMVPPGTVYTVSFPKSGVRLFDGTRTDEEAMFGWPNDFPPQTSAVE